MVPTLVLDLYLNSGSIKSGPLFTGPLASSTQILVGQEAFVTLYPLLNRPLAGESRPLLDMLVTNGSDTLYLGLCHSHADLTNCSDAVPMLSLGFNAAKLTFQNLPGGSPLGPELMVAGAYGDLSSVLQSQVNTVADTTIEAYLPQFQAQCNVIALFSPIGDEAWPYGPWPTRPVYERNGSITINASACVMDMHVGSWEDGGEGDLIVTLLPLQTVVRFPGRRWLGVDTLLQLEEAMVFEDSYLEGDDVISVDVLQLDDQGTCLNNNKRGKTHGIEKGCDSALYKCRLLEGGGCDMVLRSSV